MTTAKDALKMIKDNDVKYVDFRFTDPRGKWQHVTTDVSTIEEDTFSEGLFLDHGDVEGDVLPLAARIGETEIDVFHVVVLDHLHYVFGGRHGTITLSSG